MEMPLTEFVVAVIGGTLTVEDAASLLISRAPKTERYGI